MLKSKSLECNEFAPSTNVVAQLRNGFQFARLSNDGSWLEFLELQNVDAIAIRMDIMVTRTITIRTHVDAVATS